ncbi:hypothetical protein CsSME_00045918 [Camellia sinensis var. sinensis]
MEAHDSSNIMEEDNQLRDASMVAESNLQEGMSEANGYVCQESSSRLLMSPKMRAVDEGGRTEIEIQNSGSIKTLCGPDNMGQGINLIVDLNSAHECNGSDAAPILDNLVVGPSRKAPLTAGLVPINICSPILHTAPMILSVGALYHPQPKQTERLCVTSSSPKCSSFQRKDTRRKLRIGPSSFGKATLNLRKEAVFRSSTAAISLSMASKSSRGSFALSEPEATLALGKALGIDFEGKDEEVLSKLKQLEAIDLEKARARVGDAN